MTELDLQNQDSSSDEENSSEMDSDEELQEAFAAGLLKPGLHKAVGGGQEKPEKTFVNNVDGLNQKLAELRAPVKAFNWIERLDHVVLKAAPVAPELAVKEADLAKTAVTGGDVHNDFQREMMFYRQAQATVLEVLPRLQSMGVPTRRPQDYYAQMAKSDDHMQKIREKLVAKQVADERLEKVKKLRQMKKLGKKVQMEVQQKRQKEKKDMLDQVKKFRKGQVDSIDFLDDSNTDGKKGKKGGAPMSAAAVAEKRKFKDKKFGFGGKKKGQKANNKDSVNDTASYRRPSAKGGFKQQRPKGGAKRPGKSKRKSQGQRQRKK